MKRDNKMDRNVKNRNILGFEEEENFKNSLNNFDRGGNDQKINSEQLFLQQNDQTIEAMNQKANVLKRVVLDIESQVQESNSLLDNLGTDMSNAQALLSGTMKKLTDLSKTATSSHMMYLIFFVVFVFFLIYLIISFTSSK
ncbi:hypothetical protein RB653_006355 [Dictyostelium firmibasis]|uniref:t-SNARE coiled-coil homology domain-containing protein n=1 Tax=Dictyostelium firmibasis TaxID=79012 RepID=A0AAN7U8S7_9MYCE